MMLIPQKSRERHSLTGILDFHSSCSAQALSNPCGNCEAADFGRALKSYLFVCPKS
jgi:hypothetical protein